MEKLVNYIVKELCSNKEAVEIETTQKEQDTVVFKVKVDESDKGKVIGKNGKIAQAIRAIVKSAASGTGKKYFVDIE